MNDVHELMIKTGYKMEGDPTIISEVEHWLWKERKELSTSVSFRITYNS